MNKEFRTENRYFHIGLEKIYMSKKIQNIHFRYDKVLAMLINRDVFYGLKMSYLKIFVFVFHRRNVCTTNANIFFPFESIVDFLHIFQCVISPIFAL